MASETPRNDAIRTATLNRISRSARSREVPPGRGPSATGRPGGSGLLVAAMAVAGFEGRADPSGRGGPRDEVEAPDQAEIAARAHFVVLSGFQEIGGGDRHAIETGQEAAHLAGIGGHPLLDGVPVETARQRVLPAQRVAPDA